MTSLGVIIGNRNFFPDHLVTESRNELLSIFKKHNIKPILLSESDTKLGGVETFMMLKNVQTYLNLIVILLREYL